ncbi:uncharacterized protein LOC120290414 [Eucalyptus grandis]|uniref:uncharacterized protein LOC120290414 n=1 Tax=Eucalyptus grandis TaxID=71139 RepID=UPI00192EECA5|nr:uncharacterized protein LOC120290414 [Eucalyptus grandis]
MSKRLLLGDQRRFRNRRTRMKVTAKTRSFSKKMEKVFICLWWVFLIARTAAVRKPPVCTGLRRSAVLGEISIEEQELSASRTPASRMANTLEFYFSIFQLIFLQMADMAITSVSLKENYKIH